MPALFALARALFGKLSLCALAGGIVGAVAGFLFGLVLPLYPPSTLTLPDVLKAGVVLGLAGWLLVLMVIGVWLRYGMAAIAAPALVNALLTGVLTVAFNDLAQLPAAATLIGIVIGIFVGTVLCRFFCGGVDRNGKADDGRH